MPSTERSMRALPGLDPRAATHRNVAYFFLMPAGTFSVSHSRKSLPLVARTSMHSLNPGMQD